MVTRLAAGADFSELARRFSDDRYRIKGGYLGEIHRGRLDREVEDVAFALSKGQVSAPIKTSTGYSVIKVLDRNESRQLAFTEVRDKLRADLQKKKQAENRDNWIKRLKASAKIEILTDFD